MKETNRQHRFLQWLDEVSVTWSRSRQEKAAAGDEFEAILDRIRANVAQIFKPLFLSSIEQEYPVAPSDPRMRDLLDTKMSKEERHPLIFSYLLEKISGSWIDAAEEALAHDDQESVIKERAKLEAAGQIRETFAALYPEIKMNERV